MHFPCFLEKVICNLKLAHQREYKAQIDHSFYSMCPVTASFGALHQPVEPEESIIPISIDMGESSHSLLMPEETNIFILLASSAPIEDAEQIFPFFLYVIASNRPILPIIIPESFSKILIPFHPTLAGFLLK